MTNEIILYQADDVTKVEVKIEDETVWLTLNQISQLFERDKSVISRHIKNIFKDGELVMEATVAKNATVQIEAGRQVTRDIDYYNLDAILSVGYRVNSKRGTQFRIWANKILKTHLLRGYSLNTRMNRIEDKFDSLSKEVNKIGLQINTELPPTQGVFFDGQIFDAYKLVSDIIRSAKHNIVLIDNYVDDSVLTLFSKKHKTVSCAIFTKNISKQLQQDADKFNQQYGKLSLKQFSKAHDRFLIIDQSEVYHIGASLKDLGKKWFAFTKMDRGSLSIIDEISEML